MEFQETFLEELFEEKSDSELDFEELEDDLVERTKIAMVLGAFEVEITDLVMSNIDNLDITSGASKKAFNSFQERFQRKPNSLTELVRSATLPILIAMAQQAVQAEKKKDQLTRLSELCGALQITQTRNKTYHANNVYNPVYWIRAQALAMDPVIGQLEMTRVIERCKAARRGELENLNLNLRDQTTTIPNNLPSKDYHELIGRSVIQKEIRESLLNPRKSSISIYGSGGLGKTACVLDVLSDLCVSEAGPEHFDFVLYASLKNEFLEAGRIVKKEVGLSLDDVKKQLQDGLSKACPSSEAQQPYSADSWLSTLSNYSDKRIVIWVDNLETLQEDIYAAFADFEDSLPRDWKLVVTSRIRTRSASSVISLKQLDLKSAAKLLCQEYKIGTGEKIDFKLAEQRAEELFCNPLAIKNTIAYLKLSGKSLNESVQVGKDAIVSFSYERIAESLSEDCKRLVEILFVTDGTSQYNAAKMTGLNIDEISEQFSNLRDLGLTSNAASDENIVNLNSNFRSYLVLHPISEADRESFKLYLEDQQYEVTQSVNVQENSHSNPLRFSFIGTQAASNPTLFETLSKGVSILGRAYKIQDSRSSYSSEEVEESNRDLRTLCKELEKAKEMIQVQDECPPEVNRFLGLIFDIFNSEKESLKYLDEGARQNDLVCLRNLFTNYNRSNPNLAIDYGVQLFKLIPNSLDNDDYLKLIDTFYRCLCSARRTDLFVEVISDRKNGGSYSRSLVSIYRAESLIGISDKIQRKRESNPKLRKGQLMESLAHLEQALDSLELAKAIGLYSIKVEYGVRKWLDVAIDLLKQLGNIRENISKSFLQSIYEFYRQNNNVYITWKEHCIENGKWSSDRESRNKIQTEQLEDWSRF